MVEKDPGKPKLLLQPFRHGLDPQGFGAVVAGQDEVHPELRCIMERMVRGFAGDQGVNALPGGLLEKGGSRSRHYGDPGHRGRTPADHLDLVMEGEGHAVHERVQCERGVGGPSDRKILPEAERMRRLEAEGAEKERAVSDVWVSVQRQVGAVQGSAPAEKGLELSESAAGDPPLRVPEEAVVDKEELGPFGDCTVDDRLACVNRYGDPGNTGRALNLQTVQSARVVCIGRGAKQGIQKPEDDFGFGHWFSASIRVFLCGEGVE